MVGAARPAPPPKIEIIFLLTATLHVLCGALALLTGVMGVVISRCKNLPTQNHEALPLTKLKEATS